MNHLRIDKKCYIPVKFVVSLNIFVRDCRVTVSFVPPINGLRTAVRTKTIHIETVKRT